jgi:hypothetical protein
MMGQLHPSEALFYFRPEDEVPLLRLRRTSGVTVVSRPFHSKPLRRHDECNGDVTPTRLMAPDTCCALAWSVPEMCTKGIRTRRDPRCDTTPSQRKRPVSWAE